MKKKPQPPVATEPVGRLYTWDEVDKIVTAERRPYNALDDLRSAHNLVLTHQSRLLDLQRELNSVRRLEAEALHDYNQKLIALETAVGDLTNPIVAKQS